MQEEEEEAYPLVSLGIPKLHDDLWLSLQMTNNVVCCWKPIKNVIYVKFLFSVQNDEVQCEKQQCPNLQGCFLIVSGLKHGCCDVCKGIFIYFVCLSL